MKTIVSVQDLIELEIKPEKLIEEFYTLTAQSVTDYFGGTSELREVACPGCGAQPGEIAFAKLGLAYRQCHACGTLYVSPRPTELALNAYYRSSPAARFWRERVLPTTEAARLEKIIQPRAEWVLDGLAEYDGRGASGLDVSANGGPLAKELLEVLTGSLGSGRIVLAHPLADLEEAGAGITVSPRALTDIGGLGQVDFITAFDVLDRCADLPAFIRAAHMALKPGGLLFITAPSISGFDLQMLWDRARAITPPDKLNLLSVEGFTALFAAPAWQLREFSTPGMFDVAAVRSAIEAEPDRDWPRFIRHVMTHHDDNLRAGFQEFLQTYRLSSFARLVVRKVG